MDRFTERQIPRFNPQWSGQDLFGHSPEPRQREAMDDIEGYMALRQMLVISGPRRAGKTTVMKLLMKGLMDTGTEPQRIMYYSFDEVGQKEPGVVDDVISFFLEKICPSRPTAGKKAYLFLDEVQYVPYWATMLKRFYETVPHLKMVVSGSSSLEVSRGSGESLAGRRFDFTVLPLSFREYLSFTGLSLPKVPLTADERDLKGDIIVHGGTAKSRLDDYLVRGGFPETVGLPSTEIVHQYLSESVLGKVIGFDIPMVESVRNPAMMRSLLDIIASISSRTFELGNMGSSLGLTRQTISSYVSMLERAHIVSVCPNYTKSKVKQARTAKRIYITDPGLMSSLMGFGDSVSGPDLGRLAETAVYGHLSRVSDPYFWRDARGNEVDIVLADGKEVVPVEVKYQRGINKGDAKGLVRFCEAHGVKDPIMVTRDTSGTMEVGGYVIRLVPMWRALLSV